VKDESRAGYGAVAGGTNNSESRGELFATAPNGNRYARLYAKASIPCLALDPWGIIREANLAAGELLGTAARELVGQSLFRFLVDRQQVVLHDHFQRLAEHSSREVTQLALRVPGSVHPIVVQIVSTIANEDDCEVVSVLIDITERRRAEMVLDFLDNAGQALSTVATTTAGVIEQIPELAVPLLGDFCVVEIRDVANVIHHAAGHLDATIGARLRDLGSEFFELPGIKPSVARALAGAGPQLIERLENDGRYIAEIEKMAPDLELTRGICSVLIVPLEGRGSVFGTIAIGTVGERVLAAEDMPLAVELARRASLVIDNGRLFSELYDANAAKDRFLAMLSHELRTPLTPVLAAASAVVAQDSTRGYDVIALFKMIQRNIQLEARLIDDLLDLTRVSRGQFDLAFDDVDLHEIVRSVVAICQSDADRKGVTLVAMPHARNPLVRGDPARLEQILWNLLKNAIKFTPSRGRVTVSTENAGDEIQVAVEDTGIGIEPERMARIFLPFVQADPSISRNFGGMGLGLSISKSLAEAHQGSIVVGSRGPGRGSTFTLVLRSLRSSDSIPPTGPELEALVEHAMPIIPRPPKVPASQPSRAALRVLLVEDDPDTLEVTSMLLVQGGYDVATAKSVAQALTEVNDHEFDLLISDIALTDGSGLDLMREIHEQHKELKGIALSGFGTQEDVRRTKLAGFTAHLTKPVSFPRLVTTIRQVTG
jgi:PAS domain S-box-containing protein